MFCTVPLQAQNVDNELHRISKVAASINTMECDFVQKKCMKMLNEEMVSRGKLYYSKADHLRWEYTKPYQYIFIINGTEVLLNKGQRTDKINVNQNKVFKEIARIMMNSVIGKTLTDSKDFETSLNSVNDEWIATMVPRRSNMKKMFKTIKLHFSKKVSMVSSVEITEFNGDITHIELKNVKINEQLPENCFDIY